MRVVRAMVVLVVAAFACAPAAHADPWIETYRYPRPAGMLCPTVGGGECWETSVHDVYRQRVQDTGVGNNWGWMYTPTGQFTVHMNSTCWYGYKGWDVWRQYGSPVGARICVRVGAEWVEHEFTRLRFADLPAVDRPWFEPDRFLVTEFRTRTGELISDQPVARQLLEGTQLEQYCAHFNARDIDGRLRRGVALDRAPGSVMEACGLHVRVSDLPPEPPNDDAVEGGAGAHIDDEEGDRPLDGVTIPGSAARCGAVASRLQRINVRAIRHRCGTARSVLRSYARSLRSPPGWSCMAVVRDSALRARCMRRASARARSTAAVFGIWQR